MATTTQVVITCDYPHLGDEAVTAEGLPVAIAWDGQAMEGDACPVHESEIRDLLAEVSAMLAPYLLRMRPAPVKAPQAKADGKRDRDRGPKIRAWARANGIQVDDRGAISRDIIARYEAAQGG